MNCHARFCLYISLFLYGIIAAQLRLLLYALADISGRGTVSYITDCKILPADASDIAYVDDTGSFTLDAPCEYIE